MSGKFKDNHTLYITNSADNTSEDLVLAVKRSLLALPGNANGKLYPCSLYANAVQDKDYHYLGFAYLWVSNIEVYNMLQGLEPNGRERFEVIESTDEDSDEELDLGSPVLARRELDLPTSWGDLMEEREAKMVKIPLPSLMPVIPIKEAPKLTISPAFVYDNSEEFKNHILVATGVPKWVTPELLRPILRRFSANDDPNYPLIKVTSSSKGNGISITYTSGSRDGQFALLLAKKLVVCNRKKEEKTLFFAHPRRKNTD